MALAKITATIKVHDRNGAEQILNLDTENVSDASRYLLEFAHAAALEQAKKAGLELVSIGTVSITMKGMTVHPVPEPA